MDRNRTAASSSSFSTQPDGDLLSRMATTPPSLPFRVYAAEHSVAEKRKQTRRAVGYIAVGVLTTSVVIAIAIAITKRFRKRRAERNTANMVRRFVRENSEWWASGDSKTDLDAENEVVAAILAAIGSGESNDDNAITYNATRMVNETSHIRRNGITGPTAYRCDDNHVCRLVPIVDSSSVNNDDDDDDNIAATSSATATATLSPSPSPSPLPLPPSPNVVIGLNKEEAARLKKQSRLANAISSVLVRISPWFSSVPQRVDMSELEFAMPLERPMSYEEAVKHIKPFDLFTTRGHTVNSKVIQLIQRFSRGCNIITHVGYFCNTDILPVEGMEPGEWYVVEAVISGGLMPDVDTVPDILNRAFNGGQIRSLRRIMTARENGTTIFGWASLNDEARAIVERNCTGEAGQRRVAACLDTYLGRPYPSNACNFLYGMTPLDMVTRYAKKKRTPIGDDYFCSELCMSIAADPRIGLLPSEMVESARLFYPVDFLMPSPVPNMPSSLFKDYRIIQHPSLT